MQVSVESGEGLERRMTVELPSERIDSEVDKRLKDISRKIKMDGFRPGKVPFNIVRKQYAGQVYQEVFGELVESTYGEAVQQESLLPAGTPRIEPITEQKKGTMGYVAVFEVMPEIELKPLTGTIKKPIAEVTDEDQEQMIDTLRKQRQTWGTVDRAAQNDDQLTINFKGTIDGELFEGGEAKDIPLLLGSNSMIEGFEEGLVGAAKGETRTLALKFPEDYSSENLAGKDVSFEVEVTEVSEGVLPEVDDEFAKLFGMAEGGAEKLREDIRSNMERELAQRIKTNIKNQAMDLLFDSNAIDVPAALVEQEIDSLLKQATARMQGMAPEGIKLPREIFQEQAKRRVVLGLVIAQIVEDNEIKVDADRVRTAVEGIATGYEKPEEVIEHYYNNHQELAGVENVVLEDQVVDWVLQQVSVEDEASNFSDLTKDDQSQPF
ncbi:MAG: trigger factor [Candidatus Polarisedimenticolaceae bacterium]|nr:trigger factor [Candidatus Polarisedimenticolaceae bacterium]